jgi:hypothetical protein
VLMSDSNQVPEARAQDRFRQPYVRSRDMALDPDRCFLCGAKLRKRRSDEDVFPKWLLRRYSAWDKKLTLLNGTEISYRRLKIPCCKNCNNRHLSRIERRISEAMQHGYEGVAKVPRLLLYLWMAKIFYGVHIREIQLPSGHGGQKSLLRAEHFRHFQTIHMLLQAVRGRAVPRVFPASIFVLRLQPFPPEHETFEYIDSLRARATAFRLGDVGIISCLSDWGAVEAIHLDAFGTAKSLALHPVQFMELAAWAFYYASLVKDPDLLIGYGRRRFEIMPQISEDGPELNAPVMDEFIELLGHLLHQSPDLLREGSGFRTSLSTEDGRPHHIPIESSPPP